MEAGASTADIFSRRDHRCGLERREARVMTTLAPLRRLKVRLVLGYIDMTSKVATDSPCWLQPPFHDAPHGNPQGSKLF